MLHFTYQTKNLINGKTYIGVHSTNDIGDGYIGCGVVRASWSHRGNLLFQRAVRKYGYENFKMIPLAFFDTPEEAFEEERFLVDAKWTRSQDNYNTAIGGRGGDAFTHLPEERLLEIRKTISEAHIGKILSQEHKNKIGEGNRGKLVSKETRKKISQLHKGKLVSKETREKLRVARIGKSHTQQSKQKMSLNNKGKPGRTWTADDRKKVCKYIVQTPKGVFYGYDLAAEAYGIGRDSIKWRCLSTKEKWKGFISTSVIQ